MAAKYTDCIYTRWANNLPQTYVYFYFSTFLQTKTKLIVTCQNAINFECVS